MNSTFGLYLIDVVNSINFIMAVMSIILGISACVAAIVCTFTQGEMYLQDEFENAKKALGFCLKWLIPTIIISIFMPSKEALKSMIGMEENIRLYNEAQNQSEETKE